MRKESLFFLVVVLGFLISCNSKENKEKYNRAFYRAVNKRDTAVLDININAKRFYGRYEISYYEVGKDSGEVRGDITGDTLRGDFHYKTHGGSWKRVPLALLKKDNKLFLGTGVIGTIYSLPCYVPGVPIDYNNPQFLFEEVKE